MATTAQFKAGMSVTSGGPSGRSMVTSLGLHLFVLAVIMLVPMEAQSRTRPRELDVVFHRPAPIEAPKPLVTMAPPKGTNPARPKPQPQQVEPPAPAVVSPEPPIPGQPTPNVGEAPPEPKAGKAGILAFKDKLASLAQDRVTPRLGADAKFHDAQNANQSSSSSTLSNNSPGASRGIDTAALSRRVGGGGGGGNGDGAGGIDGVEVGRATSTISGIGGGDRPLSHGGAGPARTDEEIQIVFDRYKAQFYRLYNRELRKDPTLKGQIVLRLTIEPDGSVSMCKQQSSDMNAPDLSAQVVSIVLTINFGAKEGVQALTISYPIDFLPAS